MISGSEEDLLRLKFVAAHDGHSIKPLTIKLEWLSHPTAAKLSASLYPKLKDVKVIECIY